MQKTKRIPTLLAIILLLITVGGIGFLFEGVTRQDAKATLSIEPKSVMVTNLTDTSFTFTWQTDELATGTLLVTSSNGKKYSIKTFPPSPNLKFMLGRINPAD